MFTEGGEEDEDDLEGEAEEGESTEIPHVPQHLEVGEGGRDSCIDGGEPVGESMWSVIFVDDELHGGS